MARNYAALPWEYKREMSALNNAEFGRLCRFLLEYSETGTSIALCGNERFFAERVMMQEDRFRDSYKSAAEKNRENGSKGGRPKKTEKNPKKPKLTKKTETETETNISPNGENIPPFLSPQGEKKKRFVPPTVEQVLEYCQSRNNGIDAVAFVDFYEARGWVVGRSPMKDWRAAVRTWENRRRQEGVEDPYAKFT